MNPELTRREAVRIGKLWKLALEMQMSEREIMCLQDGHKQQELADMFGLSKGRVSQIKAKAIRKMRHPCRIPLTIELGIAEKIGLTEKDVEHYRERTLDECLEFYRSRNRPFLSSRKENDEEEE